ncbi:MAG TPA: hypothetical protein DGA22_01870 [Acidobacterium sp.]|nr:hypothetical protein [Acidobacterium sp.]
MEHKSTSGGKRCPKIVGETSGGVGARSIAGILRFAQNDARGVEGFAGLGFVDGKVQVLGSLRSVGMTISEIALRRLRCGLYEFQE